MGVGPGLKGFRVAASAQNRIEDLFLPSVLTDNQLVHVDHARVTDMYLIVEIRIILIPGSCYCRGYCRGVDVPAGHADEGAIEREVLAVTNLIAEVYLVPTAPSRWDRPQLALESVDPARVVRKHPTRGALQESGAGSVRRDQCDVMTRWDPAPAFAGKARLDTRVGKLHMPGGPFLLCHHSSYCSRKIPFV